MQFGLMMAFSYYLQAGQCIIGAMHLWLAINGQGPWYNGIMAFVNGIMFCVVANWRAKKIASRINKS